MMIIITSEDRAPLSKVKKRKENKRKTIYAILFLITFQDINRVIF